jgi:CMP-N-acetylneuraminic acid synthetase
VKTIAFIPLKLNNERLPNKNILKFSNGLSSFDIILRKAIKLKEMKIIDDWYIFCSDNKLSKFYPDLSMEHFIERDKTLDSNETKSSDIIRSFISLVDSDNYVMLHATSPFVKIDSIEKCIRSVTSKEFNSAFMALELKGFIWHKSLPVNFKLDIAPRTQDMVPYYIEISTPYVFTKEVFYKFGGRSSNVPFIHSCSLLESIDIDTKEDFYFANSIIDLLDI